jgi:hypothetical protein
MVINPHAAVAALGGSKDSVGLALTERGFTEALQPAAEMRHQP